MMPVVHHAVLRTVRVISVVQRSITWLRVTRTDQRKRIKPLLAEQIKITKNKKKITMKKRRFVVSSSVGKNRLEK